MTIVWQVAVMHAYIDMEGFPGMQVDAALRQLLKSFRLPGAIGHTFCSNPRALTQCSFLSFKVASPWTFCNAHM